MNKIFFGLGAALLLGSGGFYYYTHYLSTRPVDMESIVRYTDVRAKFKHKDHCCEGPAHQEAMMVYDMMGYSNPPKDYHADCTRYQALRIAEWYKNNPEGNLIAVAKEWLKKHPGQKISQMPGLQKPLKEK